MSPYTPKLTVIVPTRERCHVLACSLRTVTDQNYDNLEIIVSDNFSQDGTREVVSSFKDPRIRYVNTGERVSMSSNWEFALSHVTDGWVNFMGDDDGLAPNAIGRVAEIVSQSPADAIRTGRSAYTWPSAMGHDNGRLIVPMGSSCGMQSSALWLRKALKGLARYSELPMAYHGGFISKSLFDRIRQLQGAYFSSSSPDVYSGVAIASLTDRFFSTQEPLTISGTSAHSTGTSFHSVRKDKSTVPADIFSREKNLPFHPDIPMNPDGSFPLSLHVLLYESYLQTQPLRKISALVDHLTQAKIVLASETRHRKSVEEWTRHFAEMHGLDYPRLRRKASLMGLFFRANSLMKKVLEAATSILIDSPTAPIKNVFEASIAVSVVRARGRTWQTLPRLIHERLAKS